MSDKSLLTALGLICATIAYVGYVLCTHADGALLALFMGAIGALVGIPIGQSIEKRRRDG